MGFDNCIKPQSSPASPGERRKSSSRSDRSGAKLPCHWHYQIWVAPFFASGFAASWHSGRPKVMQGWGHGRLRISWIALKLPVGLVQKSVYPIFGGANVSDQTCKCSAKVEDGERRNVWGKRVAAAWSSTPQACLGGFRFVKQMTSSLVETSHEVLQGVRSMSCDFFHQLDIRIHP